MSDTSTGPAVLGYDKPTVVNNPLGTASLACGGLFFAMLFLAFAGAPIGIALVLLASLPVAAISLGLGAGARRCLFCRPMTHAAGGVWARSDGARRARFPDFNSDDRRGA